ncbi:MAG: PAS domain S-box protein, partial [Bacteroidia bacterium]
MLRKRIDKFLGSELRKQAEEILNKLAEDNNISLPSELKRLLHELQVYRLELEMQNEELNTAQNELEISRNRLADLYDHAPIGYFTLSPIAEILMLNVTGAQMLGHKRQDLLERNLSTYINKTDKDAFNLFIRHVFESTRKQTIELKFINQKKASFYAQLEAVVVESADNNIKQCRVVMLDITERKVAEAQLKEREESLREAQEMANIGSWALNIETNKITVSPQIYHLLGMRRTAQISGEMLLNFIHPDDKDRLLKLYTKIRQDAKPFSMEYRIRLQNGKERWVYSKNKALTDQFGRVIKLSGFIQDITEQKEATALQIQAEKLETASNFARTIAHEVRNPLTTVNLSLAMLRSEAVKLADSKLSNYISTIERNVKRVDQLITQLLYSSRPNESI